MDSEHLPQEAEDATILVVEDETSLAELYRAWLAEDHHVETAYTGQGPPRSSTTPSTS